MEHHDNIWRAIAGGDRSKVIDIVEEGFDINSLLHNMLAPIHIAILENDLDMCKFIMEIGSKLELKTSCKNLDHPGFSPLHLSAYEGNVILTDFFISLNADVNSVDCSGNTIIINCIESGRKLYSCIYNLANNGCDLLIKNENGKDLIYYIDFIEDSELKSYLKKIYYGDRVKMLADKGELREAAREYSTWKGISFVEALYTLKAR